MDREENSGNNDGKRLWEIWDRRRRMAVVQVICYVVYYVYMRSLYLRRQDGGCEESLNGKKRKGREWESEVRSIRETIENVAAAIREGNVVMEISQARVYSEAEVFAELVKIGVEQNLLYSAYIFLVKDVARVRAFFGYPVDERKDFLVQMMYGAEDP